MADDQSDTEDVSLFNRKPGSKTYSSVNRPQETSQPSNGGPRRVASRDAKQGENSLQSQNEVPLSRDHRASLSQTDDDESQTFVQGDRDPDGPVHRRQQEEPYAIPPFDEMLGNVHEKAIAEAGFGRLQWLLFIILGLGLMGDGVELFMIAYILPGAEKDLCMDDRMKGWLGAIAFAGMMAGSVIWGNLADKIGRKSTLITALSVNAAFTIAGAFMPTYWLFFLCRLFSGLGIGGSIPIVFAYFGEFCPRQDRGLRIGLLMGFWVSGGIYASGFGWLIIPNSEIFELNLSESTQFHSWRVFILICVLPVFTSILGLCAMPESPRYLLQIGEDLAALGVYRKLYMWNHREAGAEYEMPEIELPSDAPVRNLDEKEQESSCAKVCKAFESFWNSLFMLIVSPLTITTLVLSVAWFSISYGYYGLIIWFPEYVKKLQQDVYFAKTNTTSNSMISNLIVTDTIDNLVFYNMTFYDVTFRDIELHHVTFQLCHMTECLFENVTAAKSSFIDSFLYNVTFNHTNIYSTNFHGTSLVNTNFVNPFQGCKVDFDINYSSRKIFLENFLTTLAALPGVIITSFIMDKTGRVKLLVTSLWVAAVSVFFIWLTDTEIAVVCLNAVFNAVLSISFNAIEVASVELYPTHLRSTAFGFMASLGRIAAILGNVSFGNFIGTTKAVPILLSASVLTLGGLVSLKMPESRTMLL